MRALLAGMAAAMLLTGCSQAVVGEAVEAKLFDPCTELPDTVLRKAGVRPDMKRDLVQFDNWHICGWSFDGDRELSLNLYSTEWRLSDFRLNNTKTGFQDIVVDGRPALEYQEVNSRDRGCTVGFDTARGSVHVQVIRLRDAPINWCERAASSARVLLSYLPD